jgi:hypothetical protein
VVNGGAFYNNNTAKDTGNFAFANMARFSRHCESLSRHSRRRFLRIAQGALGFFVQDNYKVRPILRSSWASVTTG